MTPVIVLMDADLAIAAQPWAIPAIDQLDLPLINYNRYPKPYQRDEYLSRSWNVPGTPGFIHQIGGLEKQGDDGRVSYDADNHHSMVKLRDQKIAGVARDYAKLVIEGAAHAKLLIVGWGSTYGSLQAAVAQCHAAGLPIALLQLRHLNPLPDELGEILAKFSRVLVAELNTGHLCEVLRAKYLIDCKSITQCNGQPFSTSSLVHALKLELDHEHIYA